MLKTDIKETLIQSYAKKIYGFAYSKTKNYHDANDLSQEILLQLCDSRVDFSEIENMDAYIYRICSYTWSNYIRKNQPHWKAMNNAVDFDLIPSDEDMAESYIQKELYEKLRQEVMYLGKIRREIITMFYYENKSGEEISATLGIPASTIRWHIGESKKILKERMETMDTNSIYKPVKLIVGHSGWVQSYDMNGLASDVIMQNICWICREQPLSVEEIARTLGIAAIYLEDKIDKLLYMDYLKKVGVNKYQTTFFILEYDYYVKSSELKCATTKEAAKVIWELVQPKLLKARKKLSLDGEFNDNMYTAALLIPEISRIAAYVREAVCRKNNIVCTTPKRKDGSEHWVSAEVMFRDKIKDDYTLPDDIKSYMLYSGSCVKMRDNGKLQSMQYDLMLFGGWRDFENSDLCKIGRIHEIIESGECPNDYDKEIIASLVAKGYVRVDNGVPVLLIPYLKKQNLVDKVINHTMKNYFSSVDELLAKYKLVEKLIDNMKAISPYIPTYLDKNERNSILASFASIGTNQLMYMLFKEGYLKMPSEEEQQRICTFVWEK
ncbi:MAG: RNA polymerase sigma factor [Eubacteriales bacterium]|nr:RNA polymerase sigma factor [Eubacteriales bacterium]